MAVNEGLQPVGTDQVPVDPNVRIPDHVKAAAAAAEAMYKEAYKPAEPAPQPQPEPAKEPTPEPVQQAAPQPQPEPHHEQPRGDEQNVSAEEWRHRFLSMQGRYNAAMRDKGAMEEQMRQLGEELVRTQNMVAQVQPQQQTTQPVNHNNLITEEDRAAYGDELIDLARRAAMSSVAPELEQLRSENQRLTQRVQSTGKRELFASLDQSLPVWRQINQDIRFKSWLRLPNIYTNQVRGNMLKAAVDGANAPQVLQLFRDFLAEAQATGQMAPAAQVEQQAQPAPHMPALALETLAAPGRARPASGDSQVPADKPVYSRDDIKRFYDDKRKGLYAGRQAQADAFEADLTAAQREGRIR